MTDLDFPPSSRTDRIKEEYVFPRPAGGASPREIAKQTRPGGYLVSADLASDTASQAYRSLLEVWLRLMRAPDLPAEKIEQLRVVYSRDVSILPPEEVAAIIESGGFEAPVALFSKPALFTRGMPRD